MHPESVWSVCLAQPQLEKTVSCAAQVTRALNRFCAAPVRVSIGVCVPCVTPPSRGSYTAQASRGTCGSQSMSLPEAQPILSLHSSMTRDFASSADIGHLKNPFFLQWGPIYITVSFLPYQERSSCMCCCWPSAKLPKVSHHLLPAPAW